MTDGKGLTGIAQIALVRQLNYKSIQIIDQRCILTADMIKVTFVRVKCVYGREEKKAIDFVYTLHVCIRPSVHCRRTYLTIDLSRCRRVAINRKSRNNEAVDCRASAVYIDVCVGSDDVMRMETREGEKEGRENQTRWKGILGWLSE